MGKGKMNEIEKIVKFWGLGNSGLYLNPNERKKNLRRKLRALVRKERKDAWEQGLNCRIHGKEWNAPKSTSKCTFEKCCQKKL